MSTQSGSFGDFGFGLERSTVTGKPQLAGEGLAGANEVLIAEITLTASAANIEFNDIPDDYDHLRIELFARTDHAAIAGSILMELNGDTTVANYHVQFLEAYDGGTNFAENANNHVSSYTGSTAPSNSFARSDIEVPEYAKASRVKVVQNTMSWYADSNALACEMRSMTWDTLSAITDIRFVPASGSFVSGTVARLIGVKSGATAQVGGLAKIAEVVLSGSQATIDFANIPQKYDAIELEIIARSDVVATFDNMSCYANGDTTAGNYQVQFVAGTDSTASAGHNANAIIGNATGSTSPANHWSRSRIRITNYTSSTQEKTATGQNGYIRGTGVNEKDADVFTWHWNNVAAITQLQLDVASGNFIADAQVILYGIGGAASIGSLATNYIEGLTPSYTSASALSIATGSARDGTDSVDLTVSTALSVAITTSGANGLDTGAEAASTVYYLWLIGTGAGTVAGLLSLSNTAPTMPSGYTYKRLLPYYWLNDNNSDQTPFLVDTDGVLTYTNNGATALRTAPLPSPVGGERIRVLIVDADGLTLDAQAGDTIRVYNQVSVSGGTASSTDVGSSLDLLAVDANSWVATSGLGTWTVT